MAKALYEKDYRHKDHFRFGENWRDFLVSLTPERLKIAKESLRDIGEIKGKTFLDLGCGSGLFSLAAFELGAKKVVSVDIDQDSLVCVKELHQRANSPSNWQVRAGSALNKAFLKTLGQFDIVYSWGVLHHTGEMYQAISNAADLAQENGYLYIAIYNANRTNLAHGRSTFWLKVKKRYNQSPPIAKKILETLYSSYLFLGLAISGRNPWNYIANYRSARGMSWHHDVRDWLGGYPYEFASTEEIVTFLGQRRFSCLKIIRRSGIGCNEFLFQRL